MGCSASLCQCVPWHLLYFLVGSGFIQLPKQLTHFLGWAVTGHIKGTLDLQRPIFLQLEGTALCRACNWKWGLLKGRWCSQFWDKQGMTMRHCATGATRMCFDMQVALDWARLLLALVSLQCPRGGSPASCRPSVVGQKTNSDGSQ